MYKQHLLMNLEREIFLLKQLAPIIEERDLNFRPAEKVRSTLELMQYLASIGSVILRWLIRNDIGKEDWIKIRDERLTVNRENFIRKLDVQLDEIRSYMNSITEQDLLTRIVELPNKEKMPLGAAIINAPIKWLAAYRMEVFVYLKMNGRHDISTREAWTIKPNE
jgi:hypothetical protein